VDGDNLPPALAEAILKAAAWLGRVDLRRVYAAEAGFKAWIAVPGFRTIQVGGAKNGTDLLLCIDAVEAACRGEFGAFAIASNDRDFSHLAHWLRERGHHVAGLGTSKAPETWQAACSSFHDLETQTPVASGSDEPIGGTQGPPAKVAPLSAIDLQLRDLIRAEGQGGAMEIGRLGVLMSAHHKVTLVQLGSKNWRQYLATRADLYALDPKGPTARVRWVGA
jgi:hypothetical protein